MMVMILRLLYLSMLSSSFAFEDPLFSRGRTSHFEKVAYVSTRSQPWQHRTKAGFSRRRAQVPIMSWEEAVNDKRARVYSVDMRRRQPNRYSVTSRLIFATVATYILQTVRPSVTQAGLKISERILRGEQLYRLVTPVFLHGGIFHLFFNMNSLGRTGRDVEALFGPGRFLGTYLASGVAGNLLSAVQSPVPALGASGAVFGVFGAYFTFLTRNRELLGSSAQAMTDSITQTMLFNLLYGAANKSIDNWGHLGGMIGGAAIAYWTGPRLFLCNDSPTGRRLFIDRPFIRAPAYFEAAATWCGKNFENLTSRLGGGLSFGNRPWQTQKRRRRRNNGSRDSLKPKGMNRHSDDEYI